MSALHAIIYVSSAVSLPTPPQVAHLLERARERNALGGVTGLLLHHDGSFMQYIEGPRDELLDIYRIIRADRLHRDIIELMNEPIREREFAGWSMAFDQTTLPPFIAQRRADPASLGLARQTLREVWGRLAPPG